MGSLVVPKAGFWCLRARVWSEEEFRSPGEDEMGGAYSLEGLKEGTEPVMGLCLVQEGLE